MTVDSQKLSMFGVVAGGVALIGGLAMRTCVDANPLLAAPWCGDAGASHQMLSLAHCSGCYVAAFGAVVAAVSLGVLGMKSPLRSRSWTSARQAVRG